jgi:hypothetical protein
VTIKNNNWVTESSYEAIKEVSETESSDQITDYNPFDPPLELYNFLGSSKASKD